MMLKDFLSQSEIDALLPPSPFLAVTLTEPEAAALRSHIVATGEWLDVTVQFLKSLAGAPDSQVSSFIRAACAAVVSGAGVDIPPGDPCKTIDQLRSLLRRVLTDHGPTAPGHRQLAPGLMEEIGELLKGPE